MNSPSGPPPPLFSFFLQYNTGRQRQTHLVSLSLYIYIYNNNMYTFILCVCISRIYGSHPPTAVDSFVSIARLATSPRFPRQLLKSIKESKGCYKCTHCARRITMGAGRIFRLRSDTMWPPWLVAEIGRAVATAKGIKIHTAQLCGQGGYT